MSKTRIVIFVIIFNFLRVCFSLIWILTQSKHSLNWIPPIFNSHTVHLSPSTQTWLCLGTTVVGTSWLGSSKLAAYGGRGSANQATPASAISSAPPPLGKLSWESTTPNLGLRSNSNSGSVPSSSIRPASLSSFAPVPLRHHLLRLLLFPSSILTVSFWIFIF